MHHWLRRRRATSHDGEHILLAALLPLCSALLAPQTRTHAQDTCSRAVVNYVVEEGGERQSDAALRRLRWGGQDAANGLLGAMQDGSLKLRLDFDTSMGDETYTKLKLSTEFARDVAIEWALSMEEDEFGALLPGRGGRRSGAAGVEDG